MQFYLKIFNICLCETWFNKNNSSSELLLQDYDIYRADRRLDGNKNTHGCSLIAVKNYLHTEKYAKDLPHSCVAVKLKIDNSEIIVCAFYNPPANSTHRCNADTFCKLFNLFPKNTPFLNIR